MDVLLLLVGAGVVDGMLEDERQADDYGDSAEDEGNNSAEKLVVSDAPCANELGAAERLTGRRCGK